MITIVVYSILLIVITPPLGRFMYRVYTRDNYGRVERFIYRALGVDPDVDQPWRRYASSVLWFSLTSMVVLYVLQRIQGAAPLNPLGLVGVDKYAAFNDSSRRAANPPRRTRSED